MPFTEPNAVEHFIIHQLSGVNLNIQHPQEPQAGYRETGNMFLPTS